MVEVLEEDMVVGTVNNLTLKNQYFALIFEHGSAGAR
jgi:hypothetical protein